MSHPTRAALDRFEAAAPHLRRALFEAERAMPLRALQRVVAGADLAKLDAAGLVRIDAGVATPLLRIDLVEKLFLASDLQAHRWHRDFVLGPGPAGSVVRQRVRRPVRGPLLDLGTGSGYLGLAIGDASMDGLGLDINPRAVEFARFNAAINGRPRFRAEVGDFLGEAPDRRLDRRFATVVANPPFVLSPRIDRTYRDRSLPRDEVGARTVERVIRALTRDGLGYVLCNGIDVGDDPDGPVLAWARAAGATASVERMTTRDPEAYAATWTRDLPTEERGAAAASWAASLRAEGIDRIHGGLIELAPRRMSWRVDWRPASTSAS